ncbi:MAG: tRNA (adenosine(37)-N6)-threonylcarbamoyltransferase complex transferase subunit TsaD [Bacteroidota bacterium]
MSLLLAIESSCDETAASILKNDEVLSNIIASQIDHSEYGGVIPELASRLHQQSILKVIDSALRKADVKKEELDAIAFTQGPGLLGALLVGTSFAKAMAFGLGIPLIEVNHMQAHVLANFLSDSPPEFPFICLTVSGGHTQLVLVRDYLDMEIIGQSIDDAAGEAFDKAAKIMDLPYPGGPQIDKLAKIGNPKAFQFPKPDIGEFEFSFSGLKTSILYKIRDGMKNDSNFLQENMADLAASYQRRIVNILLDKLSKAAKKYEVKHLAIAGGVSANSELRSSFQAMCEEKDWVAHIPAFEYCTDNAAMIGIAGYYKFLAKDFSDLYVVPFTRGF